MDLYDTTNVLFRKIKSLDPENASKIMGYILIQDLPDRDLLRLAFGPETLLQSLVFKAKAYLGLSSSTFSTPLNPISRPNSSNSNNLQNPLPPSSPGFIPRNGFLEFSKKAPSWSPASCPKSSPFLSYENIRSGSLLVPSRTGDSNTDFIDENQMSDYFSFLNDSSSKNEDLLVIGRVFCKMMCFRDSRRSRWICDNVDVTGAIVGSPSKMDLLYRQHEEVMRVRAAAHQHQQRLAAAQLMAGASSPLHCQKNTNFLLQQQADAQRAAALMVGEEICKFAQGRAERNGFFAMGLAEKPNSASKQIYLTFPADSSFKDEDVSSYFSLSFLCIDFVTINGAIAGGNTCNNNLRWGTFSPCSSPSGLDSREPYDLHAGAKMLYNAQEMMLRRELEEQADLQQAIELQRRRFMNLQLPDFKNDGIHHHQRSLSVGASISLPAYSHAGQNVDPSDNIKQEVLEVNGDNTAVVSSIVNASEVEEVESALVQNAGVGNSQEHPSPKGSVEHALPDSTFASPNKSTENHLPEQPASMGSKESSASCAASSSDDPLRHITSTSGTTSV
ncbi:Nucleic acid binding protein, putative isoform 2 [Hibiscus syriacus]|uniref:Nucleic acid binding protein, putative isoform 2 n=1 Tax=Hibiscus syriacus TaxID=106335 RepID=A0A6A2Y300_HIBSY|nr:Nucleic acid binding protein, putative isoform 2 [Hibiscus syriacus]